MEELKTAIGALEVGALEAPPVFARLVLSQGLEPLPHGLAVTPSNIGAYPFTANPVFRRRGRLKLGDQLLVALACF